jgi:hypothetical protein
MSKKPKVEFYFSIRVSMKKLKQEFFDSTLTREECDEIFSRVNKSSLDYETWYWLKDTYDEVIAERNVSAEEV